MAQLEALTALTDSKYEKAATSRERNRCRCGGESWEGQALAQMRHVLFLSDAALFATCLTHDSALFGTYLTHYSALEGQRQTLATIF